MVQNSVVTLIASPAKEPLTLANIATIQSVLKATGCRAIIPDWLHTDVACDVLFDRGQILLSEIATLVAEALSNHQLDWAVQPSNNRKKKLLISDMDSTMIGQECIDELADAAGIGAKVADITERAMQGELDFVAALEERISLLTGLDEATLETVYAERITLNAGARTLVQTMKKNGAYALLVSGGFTFFTTRVRETAGFDEDDANTLDFADGKLTGKVIHPVLDKQAKLDSLNAQCKRLNITPADVLAVGDGANDLPMIEAAGLGVSYHGKPVVQDNADASVNHSDLTTLLYLQGYRHNEFVE